MGGSSSAANFDARVRASLLPCSLPQAATLALRFVIPVCVFLLPLIVWPGLDRPFSSPKLLAWCVVTLLVAGLCAVAGRWRRQQAPAGFVITVSLVAACVGASAGLGVTVDLGSLLLVLTAMAWFLLLQGARADAHGLAKALVVSASVMAAIALLQFVGLDMWRAVGWTGVGVTDPRMRIYATLGNPNFVGAFMAGAFPMTLALAFRASRLQRELAIAALLQGLAIAATGSRAAVLGAFVGIAVVLAKSEQPRKWLSLALSLVVGLGIFNISPARSLVETIDGRLYVWRVSATHLPAIPIFGHGPGAFEGQFMQWQPDYFSTAPHAADFRFAAQFDHAHNDYLEWLVNYGWTGLAALGLCFALFLFSAWRTGRTRPLARAALGGVCAILAVALVDFPLQRPAELFLLVTLMALSLSTGRMRDEVSELQNVV